MKMSGEGKRVYKKLDGNTKKPLNRVWGLLRCRIFFYLNRFDWWYGYCA